MIEEVLERAADAGACGSCDRHGASRTANGAVPTSSGKSMVQLFAEFEGEIDPDSIEGSGDVKYHLGAEQERETGVG